MAISIPNAEEIAVKLNIDVSDAKKMQDALRHAGGESHKSFLHADSAAKGFKKTLHELSDQIPILGYGLRALLSPIGASFAVAAAGIAYATKALDDFNKKLDETGKLNAMGTGAKKESWWSGFYRTQAAAKAGSDAAAEGKPAFQPSQAESVFQGSKHAAETAGLLDRTIEERSKTIPEDSSGMRWWDPSSYSRAFGGMASAVGRGGWRSLLKPGAARRAIDAEEREALNRLNQARQMKDRAEDAKTILEHVTPTNNNPSNPLSMLSGLGLGTIFSGVRGVSQIAQLRSTVDAVRGTMPTIDNATGGYGYKGLEYHGLDYKPISGAVGSASWKLGHPDAAANSQAAAMDQILELAKSGGFNVTIKDVAVQ